MPNEVDKRVLEMEFDNTQFKKNMSDTLRSLEEFKKKCDFDAQANSVKNLEKSFGSLANAQQQTFSLMEKMLYDIGDKIGTAWSSVGRTIENGIGDIKRALINLGKDFTIRPLKSGFGEYEDFIGAVQTIYANTKSKGTTLDDINAGLEELNKYADQTIYNFTQMTTSVGKFANAGVGLEDSIFSIKGLSNLAALAGATAAQGSSAMYNMSQAISSGVMQAVDWRSMENNTVGGKTMQNALIRAAKVMGIKGEKAAEGFAKLEAGEISFRDSLSSKWLTSDILLEVMREFSGDMTAEQLHNVGYTEKQVDEILEEVEMAKKAATEVKTFSQLLDTLKEAAGSGWTQTWQIVIGDYEEAKGLFTGISDALGNIINSSSEARNSVLKEWKELKGRDSLISVMNTLGGTIGDIGTLMKDTFGRYLPKIGGKELSDFTKKLQAGATAIRHFFSGPKNSVAFQKIFYGIAKALSLVGKIVSFVWNITWKATNAILPILNSFVRFIGSIARLLGRLFGDTEDGLSIIEPIIEKILKFLDPLFRIVGFIIDEVGLLIETLDFRTADQFFASFKDWGENAKQSFYNLWNIIKNQWPGYRDKLWQELKTFGQTLLSNALVTTINVTTIVFKTAKTIITTVAKSIGEWIRKTFTREVDKKGNQLPSPFDNWIAGIKDSLSKRWTDIKKSISDFWNKSIDYIFGPQYDKLNRQTDSRFDVFIKNLKDNIEITWTRVKIWFSNTLGNLWSGTLQPYFVKAWGDIQMWLSTLPGKLIAFVVAIPTYLRTAFETVKSFFRDNLFGKGLAEENQNDGLGEGLKEKFKSFASTIGEKAGEWLDSAWESVKKWIRNLPYKISSAFDDAIENLKSSETLSAAGDWLEDKVNKLKNNEIYKKISDFFSPRVDELNRQIDSPFEEWIGGLKEKAVYYYNAAKDWVTTAIGDIKTWFAENAVVQWIKEKATGIWDGIVGFFKPDEAEGESDSTGDWFSNLKEKIVYYYNAAKDWVLQAYEDVKTWFSENTVVQWIKEKASGLWGSILEFFSPGVDSLNRKTSSPFVQWITGVFEKVQYWAAVAKLKVKDFWNAFKESGVLEKVVNWVRNAFAYLKEINILDKIKTVLMTIAGVIFVVGKGLWNLVSAAVKFIKDHGVIEKVANAFGRVFEAIKTLFTADTSSAGSIFEKLKIRLSGFGTILADSFKWIKETAKAGLKNVVDAFKDGSVQKEIDEWGKGFVERFKGWLSDLKSSNLLESVKNVAETIKGVITDIIDALSESFGTLFNFSAGAEGELTDAIASAAPNIDSGTKSGLNDVLGTVRDIVGMITDVIQMIQNGSILNKFKGVGKSFETITKGIGDLKSSTDKVSGNTENILKSLTGFSNSITVKKIEKEGIGKTILKIAASIGILVAALWVLSKMKKEDIAASMAVIFELVGAISVLAIVAKVSGRNMNNLTALVASIAILTLCVKSLGSMDTASLVQALAAVGVIGLVLAGIALLSQKVSTGIKSNSGLISIAASTLLLAASMKIIASIDTAKAFAASGIISALLWELVGVIAVLPGKKECTKIIGLSAGILLLSVAFIALGRMKAGDIFKAINAIGALAGAIIGISYSLKGAEMKEALTAFTMLAAIIAPVVGAFLLIQGFGDVAVFEKFSRALLETAAAVSAVAKTLNRIPIVGGLKIAAVFDILVADVVGVIYAIGAIKNKWGSSENAEKILNEGIEMFGAVGNALGNFVGGILNGIMVNCAEGISAMGSGVADFVTNLSNITDDLSEIDTEDITKLKDLAGVMQELAGVDTSITTEDFTLKCTWLAEGLNAFGTTVGTTLADNKIVKALESANTAGSTITDLLDTFANTKLSRAGTAQQYAADMKEAFPVIGEAFIAYSDNIAGVTTGENGHEKISQDDVNVATAALDGIVGLYSKIPEANTWEGQKIQAAQMDAFVKEIPAFGAAMSSYATWIKGFTAKLGGSDNSSEAIKIANDIVKLWIGLPETGGWKQKFNGEKDLGSFIEAIGYVIGDENGNVTYEEVEDDAGSITRIFSARSPFGEALTAYAEWINTFDASLGKKGKENSENAIAIATSIAGLWNALPETGASVEFNRFDFFGKMLSSFSLTFDEKHLDSFIQYLGTITEDAEGIEEVSSPLGEAFKAYAKTMSDIDDYWGDKGLDNSAETVAMMETLADLWSHVVNDDFLGLNWDVFLANILDFAQYTKRFGITMRTVDTKHFADVKSTVEYINDEFPGLHISDDADKAMKDISKKTKAFAEIGDNFKAFNEIGAIGDKAIERFDAAKKVIDDFEEWIKTFPEDDNDLPNGGYFEGIVEAFKDFYSEMYGFNGVGTDVAAGLKNEKVWAAFVSSGEYMARGLAAGFYKGEPYLSAAASDEVNFLYGRVNQYASINSPSKLFETPGMWMALGLAKGFRDSSSDLDDSAESVALNAYETMKSALEYYSNLALEDMDTSPTITPVLDMTEIQNGKDTLNNLFGSNSDKRFGIGTIAAKQVTEIQTDKGKLTNNFSSKDIVNAINNLETRFTELSTAVGSMSIVMDSGALVGQISSRMDQSLGAIAARRGRGN